jgi:hypothetical protein
LKKSVITANRVALTISTGPGYIFEPMGAAKNFLAITVKLVLALVKMLALLIDLEVASSALLENRHGRRNSFDLCGSTCQRH